MIKVTHGIRDSKEVFATARRASLVAAEDGYYGADGRKIGGQRKTGGKSDADINVRI